MAARVPGGIFGIRAAVSPPSREGRWHAKVRTMRSSPEGARGGCCVPERITRHPCDEMAQPDRRGRRTLAPSRPTAPPFAYSLAAHPPMSAFWWPCQGGVHHCARVRSRGDASARSPPPESCANPPLTTPPPRVSRCAVPACANLSCRRSHPLDRGGSVYRMGSGASSDNIVLLSEQGSEIIADATKGSNLESAAGLRESTDRPDAPRSVSGGGGHGSGAVSDAPELRATAPADEDTSGRTARTISIEAPRLWNENDEAFQGAPRHSLRQPAPDSPQPYTGRYRRSADCQ